MAVEWFVAPDLDIMLSQVNRYAPARSKRSDGSIGDAAHATRDSDHNPWLALRGKFWVTARDFTHDPRPGGFDAAWLAGILTKSRDPRLKYIIWNWNIWYPVGGWKPYTGKNGHETHCHVSVKPDESIFNVSPWTIPVMGTATVPRVPGAPPVGRRNLGRGMSGADVGEYQEFMNRTFPGYADTPIPRLSPPLYGPQTERVTKDFQGRSNLAPDGIVGPQVYAALARLGFPRSKK